MRPTPKQLLRAFFAYFAVISALGPGFHFWPVLGCHDHACHADHAHTHVHDHAHASHQHESPGEEQPGEGHDHDHCLACQYYAQTQLDSAERPEIVLAFFYYPAPALARQMPAAALPSPYAPRGPPQA